MEGKKTLLEDLITDLKKGPVGARVVQVQVEWSQATGRYIDFAIW